MNYQSNQGVNIFGQQPKVVPPPPPPPSQPTVMFLKFSQIPFLNTKEIGDKIEKLNQYITNTNDWKKIHQAIDILRSFNKSFPEQVNSIVETFGTYILKFLSCTKKEIVKNALALIQEIFMNCRIVPLHPSSINILVSSVLQILDNTNKLSVKDCLVSLAQNCISNETLMQACNISVQSHTSTIGLKMIARFLENLGQNFTQLQQESLVCLMKCLSINQTSQDPEVLQQTNQIALFIYSTIGDNFFQLLIQNTLNSQEQAILIQQMSYMYSHQQNRAVLQNQTNQPQSYQQSTQGKNQYSNQQNYSGDQNYYNYQGR